MGFEPMEHICSSDFKTDALSHSATLPYGAGEGGRTRNLLITNQLLCQLSYTSIQCGAVDEIRTRNTLLGRQVIYH